MKVSMTPVNVFHDQNHNEIFLWDLTLRFTDALAGPSFGGDYARGGIATNPNGS
jgi:hypothetical protein